jgi:hypothetical protein
MRSPRRQRVDRRAVRASHCARRGAYEVPAWLSEVQIARLQAAAERDVAGRDSATALSRTRFARCWPLRTRARICMRCSRRTATSSRGGGNRASHSGVGRAAIDRGGILARAHLADASARSRRGTSWVSESRSLMVDDSTQADVHVTWRAQIAGSDAARHDVPMTGAPDGSRSRTWCLVDVVRHLHGTERSAPRGGSRARARALAGDAGQFMAAATEGRQYQLTDADRATAGGGCTGCRRERSGSADGGTGNREPGTGNRGLSFRANARNPRRPGREPSIGISRIPRFARNDSALPFPVPRSRPSRLSPFDDCPVRDP